MVNWFSWFVAITRKPTLEKFTDSQLDNILFLPRTQVCEIHVGVDGGHVLGRALPADPAVRLLHVLHVSGRVATWPQRVAVVIDGAAAAASPAPCPAHPGPGPGTEGEGVWGPGTRAVNRTSRNFTMPGEGLLALSQLRID